ncbi:MAG: tRNA uridine-5-carboxymethylaminomethyl(34) synthesis enzyme MnmG [Candidatus Zixiibacteriota bacterium]
MSARDFDIIVVGGGHAGVEAALAPVRMGATVALVSMDKTKLALMSCNPAIGGIGKSHLVKEVDALGGLMGQAIDATGIQFRRLNLSRGPAVWSTRAQADRIAYTKYISDFVAAQKNLTVIEAIAGEILTENGQVAGIRTEAGEIISARAVILATGTFLGGLIHIGKTKIPAGRMGEKAAYQMSESLRKLGFEVGRLKTGTPPRLDGKTIDWDKCQIQPGEEPVPFFSYRSGDRRFEQVPCHLTRTTEATKEIILTNARLSPIFSGQIISTGPRYCPSIETKFHRFADKPTHHIFLEPEGNGTSEIYPNGFSTALPEYIQEKAIRTVIGLEHVEMTKPGYAIEYDYCPAYQLKPSLEARRLPGLFFAGQINGTSGYEEAAAQGLIAGVNAVAFINDDQPLIFDRSEAYIGVMIDDLVTRSTTEPYRMFTSRAEYRLALREDNARDRLFDNAYQYGLIDPDDYRRFKKLQEETHKEIGLLRKIHIGVDSLGELTGKFQRTERVSLEKLLKLPGVSLDEILPVIKKNNGAFTGDPEILQRAAIFIRYQGYIDKQQREIDKFKKLESEKIPSGFAYETVSGLKNEAREKFLRYRPVSLGQAGRLEGVTPGDIAVLSVYLKKYKANML